MRGDPLTFESLERMSSWEQEPQYDTAVWPDLCMVKEGTVSMSQNLPKGNKRMWVLVEGRYSPLKFPFVFNWTIY